MATNTQNLSTGEYLRLLRLDKGLSQKELADAIGVDFTLVSKIELGERTLGLDMIPNLASALEMDFKALQIELMALRVAEEYGDEEYALEAIKKALKRIE